MKFLVFVFLTGWHFAGAQDIIFHRSHEPAKQNAPYSDAVEANGFLFLAGQIGMDQTTRTLVPGGIKAETEQTIKNIEAVLKHHGLTLEHVVKCTVILSTMDDFAALNEVYTRYFTKNRHELPLQHQASLLEARWKSKWWPLKMNDNPSA